MHLVASVYPSAGFLMAELFDLQPWCVYIVYKTVDFWHGVDPDPI